MIGERAAGHEAHDKIWHATLLAEIIDRDNRRMFERGNGLRFAFKAGAERWVVQKFARQNFDRHVAFEARVVSMINRRHAAAPQLGFDFVTTNHRGCH